MVAARLANLGEGRPSETASIDAVSQIQAADMLNVSRPSVQRARAVIDNGATELVDDAPASRRVANVPPLFSPMPPDMPPCAPGFKYNQADDHGSKSGRFPSESKKARTFMDVRGL
jgi:hypothetical protein